MTTAVDQPGRQFGPIMPGCGSASRRVGAATMLLSIVVA